jgi:hypothetical protein
MTTYIVETWRAPSKDGSAGIKAQIQIRDYAPDKGPVWRHKAHTTWGFDYALGHSGNRENAVRYAVRVALQQDPIAITYSGETARGYLYIVEVNDICAKCDTLTIEGSDPVFEKTEINFIPHKCA